MAEASKDCLFLTMAGNILLTLVLCWLLNWQLRIPSSDSLAKVDLFQPQIFVLIMQYKKSIDYNIMKTYEPITQFKKKLCEKHNCGTSLVA